MHRTGVHLQDGMGGPKDVSVFVSATDFRKNRAQAGWTCEREYPSRITVVCMHHRSSMQ